MDSSSQEGGERKKVTDVKTFPVPFSLGEKKENITISMNNPSKSSKEQIINQAIQFHLKGNIPEATKYYQHLINQECNDHRVFSNYGNILKDLGRLKEAELLYRKAIEINPKYAIAYYNLGTILIDLGHLKHAENCYLSSIKINNELSIAYYSLSKLKYNNDNKVWQNKLFSESILYDKSTKDKINIYFARANTLHKNRNYEESSKYLLLANKLKIDLNPSNSNMRINKSKILLIESNKEQIRQKENTKYPQSIFIVGMPRSGSTLLESIISMNSSVESLGEVNIFEESFVEQKKVAKGTTLTELYWKKINNNKDELKITSNKWLYNYQYAGIIAKHITSAKIIHCFRNPLDNILSIFRAHFAKGNEYSSSLVDCTKVYLDQEEVMTAYKNRYRSKIYDLNYDLLVDNPKQEIQSLIDWLGWQWNDSYLSPHLNPRSILTRSNIEVRSPINSNSIDGWKNYKDMLKPAIEILTQTNQYQDINS